MGDIGPGDWPTWVGAVFAAIAAGATLWTLKSQRKQIDEQRAFIGEQAANLRLERAELMAAAQVRREEQARAVTLAPTRQYASIRNNSNDPIREVACTDGGAPLERVFVTVDTANPNHSAEMLAAIIQGSANAPAPIVGVGCGASFPRDQENQGQLSFTFTDAAGIRWERDELGGLTEVPAS